MLQSQPWLQEGESSLELEADHLVLSGNVTNHKIKSNESRIQKFRQGKPDDQKDRIWNKQCVCLCGVCSSHNGIVPELLPCAQLYSSELGIHPGKEVIVLLRVGVLAEPENKRMIKQRSFQLEIVGLGIY